MDLCGIIPGQNCHWSPFFSGCNLVWVPGRHRILSLSRLLHCRSYCARPCHLPVLPQKLASTSARSISSALQSHQPHAKLHNLRKLSGLSLVFAGRARGQQFLVCRCACWDGLLLTSLLRGIMWGGYEPPARSRKGKTGQQRKDWRSGLVQETANPQD